LFCRRDRYGTLYELVDRFDLPPNVPRISPILILVFQYTPESAAVPEPESLALLAPVLIGSVALLRLKARRK